MFVSLDPRNLSPFLKEEGATWEVYLKKKHSFSPKFSFHITLESFRDQTVVFNQVFLNMRSIVQECWLEFLLTSLLNLSSHFCAVIFYNSISLTFQTLSDPLNNVIKVLQKFTLLYLDIIYIFVELPKVFSKIYICLKSLKPFQTGYLKWSNSLKRILKL